MELSIERSNASMTQCLNDSMDSFLSILNGLPKADPHIQRAQSGRKSAREAAGYHGAKHGIGKEKRVVGPLRSPRQNHEHYPDCRAQKHEEKHPDAAEVDRLEEDERLESEAGLGASPAGDVPIGDLSSPTLVVPLAKGSLGSEIITRVVVRKAVSVRPWSERHRVATPRRIPTHFLHSTTSGPECARPHRDNRCSRRTRR